MDSEAFGVPEHPKLEERSRESSLVGPKARNGRKVSVESVICDKESKPVLGGLLRVFLRPAFIARLFPNTSSVPWSYWMQSCPIAEWCAEPQGYAL
jgi:hypothetical protein